MDWLTPLADYQVYLTKVSSPSSVQTYTSWARNFAKLATSSNLPAESPLLIRAFADVKIALARQNQPEDTDDAVAASRNTLRSAIPSIRKYLNWLRDSRLAPIAVQLRPELPRTSKRLQYTPTVAEVEQVFLPAAQQYQDPYGVIFQILTYSGGRDSEIRLLKMTDCRQMPDGRIVVKITGKGNKLREVPLLLEATIVLANYLQRRSKAVGANSAWLFPLPQIRRAIPQAVSRKAVEDHMRQFRSQINLPRLTCHALRRYYVTRQRKAGIDDATICALIGHEDLSLFMVYYKPTVEDLSDALADAEQR